MEEKSAKSKDARIKHYKIDQYIGILMECETAAGEPYIKHLDEEIWELRPLRDRILFFGWDGSSFILLSHFMKNTKKTPKREIEKAKRLMEDFKERSQTNG
ncbi:MAG: type II toxin-antitoxin system RelE/ParE family toxin [Clostridiales bacterium]|nr:type II toxin-antitoxin system RelE/ParE family toxin [Clostridiales bacterium]